MTEQITRTFLLEQVELKKEACSDGLGHVED